MLTRRRYGRDGRTDGQTDGFSALYSREKDRFLFHAGLFYIFISAGSFIVFKFFGLLFSIQLTPVGFSTLRLHICWIIFNAGLCLLL